MIVCSNCLHHNPDKAGYCEACGVQLLVALSCANCGASVEKKAHFCGQCGFNLQLVQGAVVADAKETNRDRPLPEPPAPEPVMIYVDPDPLVAHPEPTYQPVSEPVAESVAESVAEPAALETETSNTRIQILSAALLHVQSNTLIELKNYQKVVHIGKPNDRIPPDINVGVLPNAEVVSRVHAAIHLEGTQCFVEDIGSANGTYVNNVPLMPGAKQRLRVGDRISLGKGDLVTFVFQMS